MMQAPQQPTAPSGVVAEYVSLATEQVVDVLEAVFAALKGPAPSRDELRQRVQDVLNAPDFATAEALKGAFDQHFPDQWDKELRRLQNG